MRIKEILKERGITSKALATSIGMTPTGLSIAIGENGNPPLSTLRKIAGCLNVPVARLFDDEEDNAKIICPHCGKRITIKVE